jgi:hypothetical protein
MNREQREKSDMLFNALKYCDRYQPLEHEDFDIYILPNKKNKDKIDVRFMDPYSGEFVRNNKNKIINKTLETSDINEVWDFTDKILDTLQKMVKGIYKRPAIDVSKVVNNETTMAKINPRKSEDLSEVIEEWQELGLSKEEAKNQAVENYCCTYHIANNDADF